MSEKNTRETLAMCVANQQILAEILVVYWANTRYGRSDRE